MKRMIRDADGRLIKVGDMVMVLGVPDLTGMRADERAKSEPVFKYLVGKYKRVTEIDRMGNAGITFRLKTGDTSVIHWVGLEPHLLRKRSRRS